MKELVKPNEVENVKTDLSFYCETHCEGRGGGTRDGTANKGCSGGATNNSINEDDDLIF